MHFKVGCKVSREKKLVFFFTEADDLSRDR